MNRLKTHLLACVAASLLLALVVVSPALVRASQQSVELISFDLRGVAAGVEIRWATGTERDIAYFLVKRGPAPSGPHTQLGDIGLIEAMGSTVSGYAYSAVDETAVMGVSYSYQLVELTLSNVENVIAEDVFTMVPTPTPEAIGGLPATGTTPATASAQTSVTPQPTTAATAGSVTPRPTVLPGGSVTPTVSATLSTGTPATTTRAASTLGPTPTRFSFTPRPAAVTTAGQTDAPVVEASGPAALAQVTTEPYPAPGGALPGQPEVTITEIVTTQVGAPEQAPAAYPGDQLGAPSDLPSSVGAGVEVAGSAGTQAEEDSAQETTGAARLLLWLGFLAAFFIFVGGIGFSIVLSTRRRENDLP